MKPELFTQTCDGWPGARFRQKHIELGVKRTADRALVEVALTTLTKGNRHLHQSFSLHLSPEDAARLANALLQVRDAEGGNTQS